MLERSRRVVLLIDYDNLQICAARDTPGRDLQLTPVVQLAQKYGTVIMSRAYAEWNLSTERLAVYKAGIEPAFAPVLRTESDRSGKSLADTVMVAEGMDMLWTLSPEVVVLATSDKDLIPLVRVAKQRGSFVVVLGSDFTAIPLREMADEHITYKQLITDASGRYTTEPTRAPAALAEPSRRRSRERNGREARSTSTSTSTPTPSTSAPSAAAPAPSVPSTSTPVSAPAAAASAASNGPEPVAPVTAGAAGDADGQIGTRRRRRRGSRRRSDRLGGPEGVEGQVHVEPEGTAEAAREVPETDPGAEPSPPMTAAEAPAPAPAPASGSEASAAAAGPRDRRRRSRRTTTDAVADAESVTPTTPAPEPSGEPLSAPSASGSSETQAAHEAPPPEATNGAASEAEARPRRTRRVAGTTRGRTRPAP